MFDPDESAGTAINASTANAAHTPANFTTRTRKVTWLTSSSVPGSHTWKVNTILAVSAERKVNSKLQSDLDARP